ncbi:DUF3376 domain-containing protein [Streptomyces sp. 3213.3]|uniref:DUF3376 domain-containing protein n=1 Tax=Streptomyces sp. 3213.3 TaxID=1855348 RepID=UPI000B86A48A
MLRLDVVQLAFSGAAQDVEQEVALIQVSATSPHLVTGRQLHHFGASWRSSWRVNDWIHGRLDGAEHIVRMLLSPERLRRIRQQRHLDPDRIQDQSLRLRHRQPRLDPGDGLHRHTQRPGHRRRPHRGHRRHRKHGAATDRHPRRCHRPAPPRHQPGGDRPDLRRVRQPGGRHRSHPLRLARR